MDRQDLIVQLSLLLGALKVLAPKDNERLANMISCTEDMLYAALDVERERTEKDTAK